MQETLRHAFAYFPVRQRLPDGSQIFRYFGDRYFWRLAEEIFIARVYEPTPDFTPKSGDTVLDLGAHMGMYTIWASRHMGFRGRVVAVEPDGKNFQLLKRNTIQAAGPQVLCVCVALWDRPGELVMSRASNHFGATSAVLKRDADSFSVKAQTLDSLTRDLGLTKVSLVKMDVEGAAPAVIRGGTATFNRWHPRIVCAAYHTPDEEAEVTALLRAAGYSVTPYDVRLPFAEGPERYVYALPA